MHGYKNNGIGVGFMTIGEYLKSTNRDTYYRLINMFKIKENKKKDIKLGDSIENLMGHNSYKRIGRRVRQVR